MIRKYILIVILIVSVCMLLLTPPLKPLTRAIFLFPAHATADVFSNIRGFFMFFSRMKHIETENVKLREDIAKLETENTLSRARITDLERINAYPKSYRLLSARIISRDPVTWFKIVTVNKGKENGITDNMPVVLSEHVIGRTINAIQYFRTFFYP